MSAAAFQKDLQKWQKGERKLSTSTGGVGDCLYVGIWVHQEDPCYPKFSQQSQVISLPGGSSTDM